MVERLQGPNRRLGATSLDDNRSLAFGRAALQADGEPRCRLDVDDDPAHPLELAQRDTEIVGAQAELTSELLERPEQDESARDRLEDAALCEHQIRDTAAWLLVHARYNAALDAAGTISAVQEPERNDWASPYGRPMRRRANDG